MVLTLTTLSLMKFLRSIMYRYGSIAVVKTQWPSIVVAACCYAEVVAARNDVAFIPGVVLLFFKDDMAVVGSGSLSLHPPPPCFSVLVSPPPRPRPCAHALPVSGSPPTVPVVSKTSGAVYEKALIERYIGQSPLLPPPPPPAAHTLQRKTAQIPSRASPSPRKISSMSRPVSAAFPVAQPLANTYVQEPSTIPPRPANQTSIPALLTALQSEYDSIMLESLEIKKAFQSSRWVCTLDRVWNHLTLLAQARTRKRVVQGGCCHASHC